MNFQTVVNKKNYYNSLQEIKNDDKRKNLKKYYPFFETIKQVMFDNWDVENVYLCGEILNKNQFISDNIVLFIEMSKDMFEEMVDSKYIQNMKTNVNFIFNVNNNVWKWKDNKWINEGELPIFKLLL